VRGQEIKFANLLREGKNHFLCFKCKKVLVGHLSLLLCSMEVKLTMQGLTYTFTDVKQNILLAFSFELCRMYHSSKNEVLSLFAATTKAALRYFSTNKYGQGVSRPLVQGGGGQAHLQVILNGLFHETLCLI
jgi:hypothetical protein